jgi:hypothetical protein
MSCRAELRWAIQCGARRDELVQRADAPSTMREVPAAVEKQSRKCFS